VPSLLTPFFLISLVAYYFLSKGLGVDQVIREERKKLQDEACASKPNSYILILSFFFLISIFTCLFIYIFISVFGSGVARIRVMIGPFLGH
jgi:Na+/H+ antiporter NhaC